MTNRRLHVVLASAACTALGLFVACSDDSLDSAGPHVNGCIGDSCYNIEAGPATDTGSPSDSGGDSAIVYGNPLDGVDLTATLVKGGFVFTEGPIWAGGHLLFSDTGQNTIFRLEDDNSTTVFRQPAGGANGNAVDNQGRLYTCEGNRGRISRTDNALANPVAYADTYNNKPFDSPNDIIVRDDGNVFFTDPAYGAMPDGGYPQDKQAVYRVPPSPADTKQAVRLTFDFNKANGIALSPDGNTLYVGDNGAGKIYSAKLFPDGTLNGTFTQLAAADGVDGIAVDLGGNVYGACTSGVLVFDKTGGPLGTIKVTGTASNVAFGGSDHKKLFITARSNGGTQVDANTGVYAVTLKVPGNP